MSSQKAYTGTTISCGKLADHFCPDDPKQLHVGMVVSLGVGSDSYVGRIVWMNSTRTQIMVIDANAEGKEELGNAMNGYTVTMWRKSPSGRWKEQGKNSRGVFIHFGIGRDYRDPSF